MSIIAKNMPLQTLAVSNNNLSQTLHQPKDARTSANVGEVLAIYYFLDTHI